MQKNPNVFVKQKKKTNKNNNNINNKVGQRNTRYLAKASARKYLYLTKKKISCPPATAVAAAVAAASGYNNDSPNALPLLPASDRFPSFAPPISSSAFAQTTHPLPLSETLLSPSLYAVWRRGGRALTIVAPRSSAAGHDGCAHFLPSFFFFFWGRRMCALLGRQKF